MASLWFFWVLFHSKQGGVSQKLGYLDKSKTLNEIKDEAGKLIIKGSNIKKKYSDNCMADD